MSDDWLTVEEAAKAYGVTARTMREWIKIQRPDILAEQVQGKRSLEWRIKPPDGYTPPPRASSEDHGSTPQAGVMMIPLAQAEGLVAPIIAERDRLLDERGDLRAQLDKLQEQRITDLQGYAAKLAEQAQEIGRLQATVEAGRKRKRWFWQRGS